MSWLRRTWHAWIAVFGLAVLAVVVQHIGLTAVLEALARTGPVLPLAILLEAVRIGCDALSARWLLGPRGAAIPFRVLFAAHVVGHGVMNVFPAGRSAAEAVKVGLLHRYLGAPEAVALGTANQANVLISNAVFTLTCLVATLIALPHRMLVAVMALNAVVLFVAGFFMRFAASAPRVERWVSARSPRLAAAFARFAESSRSAPLVAPRPILAMVLGRVAQTIEYGVLAWSVGMHVGPLEALAVQGVNLVAASTGVFVPGQLGASEAVFALAADGLGIDRASGAAIALGAHLIAIGWAIVGLVWLAVWRRRLDREPAPPSS